MCVVVAETILAFFRESFSSVESPWTTSPVLGSRIFRTAGLLGRGPEIVATGVLVVGAGDASPPPLQPTVTAATHTAAIHPILRLIPTLRRSSCSAPGVPYRPMPSRRS